MEEAAAPEARDRRSINPMAWARRGASRKSAERGNRGIDAVKGGNNIGTPGKEEGRVRKVAFGTWKRGGEGEKSGFWYMEKRGEGEKSGFWYMEKRGGG